VFYEYGIEPAALSTWERLRYFLDACGPWEGRFIAQYPSDWQRRVFQAMDDAPKAKAKATERLRALDRRVLLGRPSSIYNGERPWLENAIAEDQRRRFRAIVSEAEASDATRRILNAADVSNTDELWKSERGCHVARDPAAVIAKISLLLQASQRVALVDPYFNPTDRGKVAFLVALCDAVSQQGAAVDVHASDGTIAYNFYEYNARRILPRLLTRGQEVTLHFWSERNGGHRFHNRYLLTDIGGVKFGDSIERGEPNHDDQMNIMDEPSRSEQWGRFYSSSGAFDPAGAAIMVKGTR
jgi:hypothetical protein